MTLIEIEAFLTITRSGNISEAAEKLSITQPALSRRIHALEEKIGCRLFRRQKGLRTIELTAEGKAFIPLAEKWQNLFTECRLLGDSLNSAKNFSLGAVGSMCAYVLPETFRRFVNCFPECHFNVTQYHSIECYAHVEDGSLDLAFISNDMFSKTVKTIPAYKAPLKLFTSTACGGAVHPSDLDPAQEIRISWTPEFDLWHDYWFGASTRPHVSIDQMILMEYFLDEPQSWVIAPAYLAVHLQEKHAGIKMYDLSEPPPEEIIYYLQPKGSSVSYSAKFLELMRQDLLRYPDITILL